MKRIYYLLLLALPLLLQSCLKDDNQIFSESAADRMNSALKHHQEILVGASDGWLMEYYPEKTQKYGGYTMLMRFEANGKVTISSSRVAADKTETSMYQLIADSGPVLTFNTYNSLLHYYSDPQNPDGIGNGDTGMGGDYEFLVLESTPEKITLKGKKTGNKIIMTSLSSATNWTELLGKYKVAEKDFLFVKYNLVVGDTEISAKASYNVLSFNYQGANDAIVSVKAPFRLTPKGYEFYEPVEVNGVKFSRLDYTNEGEVFSFVDPDGSGVKLMGLDTPLTEFLLGGKWYFNYFELGEFGPSYWNTTIKALSDMGEKLYYAYMGVSGSIYGFCFASTDGKSAYAGALKFSYEIVNDNTVKFTFAASGDDNGVWYYKNAKFANLLHPISSSTTRTFALTVDDPKSPKWIQLQDKDIAGNRIKLFKDAVYYPTEK